MDVRELTFVAFGDLFFFEFLTPFTLGGHNFLIYNPYLTIVSVLYALRGGVQDWFGHQKNRAFPFNSTCLECLSVQSLDGLTYWKYPQVNPNGRGISTFALLCFTLEKQFETLQ